MAPAQNPPRPVITSSNFEASPGKKKNDRPVSDGTASAVLCTSNSATTPPPASPKLTLNALLLDRLGPPYTVTAFEDYLRNKERSEENLDFLRATRRYREKCAQWAREMEDMVFTLIDEFIKPESPREVNCPDDVRRHLLDEISVHRNFDPCVFLDIENKIFELMDTSSFPQFLEHIRLQHGSNVAVGGNSSHFFPSPSMVCLEKNAPTTKQSPEKRSPKTVEKKGTPISFLSGVGRRRSSGAGSPNDATN